MNSKQFVAGLVEEMDRVFARLGETETLEAESEGRVDVVTLLRLALKSELEASELAGFWMPTTPEVDEALTERGVVVLPDIYVNAGGVTVSYFEWAQNIQQFSWEEDRITAELARHMREAYATLARVVRERHVSLRTAAFIVAIGRVGRATVLRGV